MEEILTIEKLVEQGGHFVYDSIKHLGRFVNLSTRQQCLVREALTFKIEETLKHLANLERQLVKTDREIATLKPKVASLERRLAQRKSKLAEMIKFLNRAEIALWRQTFDQPFTGNPPDYMRLFAIRNVLYRAVLPVFEGQPLTKYVTPCLADGTPVVDYDHPTLGPGFRLSLRDADFYPCQALLFRPPVGFGQLSLVTYFPNKVDVVGKIDHLAQFTRQRNF